MPNKNYRQGTEKRSELLHLLTKMGMRASRMLEVTADIEGKTDEEKKQIAGRIIADIKAGKIKA